VLFSQDGDDRTKLNTMISFPVSNLDMSSHVKPDSTNNSNPDWNEDVSGDYMYDLYAVCNHIGNMQGGHYTG